MIYFGKYADSKFEILNKHKVFITREQVENAVRSPDSVKRKGRYFRAAKDNVAVIYTCRNEIVKIITFFPIK